MLITLGGIEMQDGFCLWVLLQSNYFLLMESYFSKKLIFIIDDML